MRITKQYNISHVKSQTDNESDILFDFTGMLKELHITHGYTYNMTADKKIKVNIWYDTRELREKLKVFKNKKLM